MWPLLGGLITGGMGLLGSFMSSDSSARNNAANIQMQRETNEMSVQEAQKNRDFQQQMSNTAYQRSSADMTAAGLNPAAMFGSGSAASTPSGGQPSLTAPQARENPGRAFESLGSHASAAVNAAVSAKTIDKMAEEISNLRQRTATEEYETPKRRQEMLSEVERSELLRTDNIIRKLGINPATLTSEEADQIRKMPPWLREKLVQTDYFSKKSTSLTDQIASGIGSAVGVKRLGAEAKRLEHEKEKFEHAKKPREESFTRTTKKTDDGTTTFGDRWIGTR